MEALTTEDVVQLPKTINNEVNAKERSEKVQVCMTCDVVTVTTMSVHTHKSLLLGCT